MTLSKALQKRVCGRERWQGRKGGGGERKEGRGNREGGEGEGEGGRKGERQGGRGRGRRKGGGDRGGRGSKSFKAVPLKGLFVFVLLFSERSLRKSPQHIVAGKFHVLWSYYHE